MKTPKKVETEVANLVTQLKNLDSPILAVLFVARFNEEISDYINTVYDEVETNLKKYQ